MQGLHELLLLLHLLRKGIVQLRQVLPCPSLRLDRWAEGLRASAAEDKTRGDAKWPIHQTDSAGRRKQPAVGRGRLSHLLLRKLDDGDGDDDLFPSSALAQLDLACGQSMLGAGARLE